MIWHVYYTRTYKCKHYYNVVCHHKNIRILECVRDAKIVNGDWQEVRKFLNEVLDKYGYNWKRIQSPK